MSKEELLSPAMQARYPRSAKYDGDWIIENQLGSHCLWLVEALAGVVDFRPGLLKEIDGFVPEYLKPYWMPGYYSWHSPEWWRWHWLHTGLVDVELSDTFPDGEGYLIFRRFEQAVADGDQMIALDEGRNFTFVRTVVRRKPC